MNAHHKVQALTDTAVITGDECEHTQNIIITLEDIVLNEEDSAVPTSKGITGSPSHQLAQETPANMDTTAKPQTANPFLPAHILQQLKQDNLNLVEEIAQSGAALTASTALLRTYQKNGPSSFFSGSGLEEDRQAARQKAQRYKMVDDLVEEYLPLIAADLKRKLRLQTDQECAES